MTTQIKKAYVELVELLEANSNKKVSTIMPQILELVTKASNGGSEIGKTFYKVEDNVVAIYCYYHKKWEPLSDVDYGTKKSSASGFSSMCKEGVSRWTKQQRVSKKEEGELLDKLLSGELSQDDLGHAKKEINDKRAVVVPRLDGIGYETLEELLAEIN